MARNRTRTPPPRRAPTAASRPSPRPGEGKTLLESLAAVSPRRLALILGALHLLLVLPLLHGAPHDGGDNAVYLAHATALLQGRGFVDLWDPALPHSQQYPPGFSTLLAGAMLLGVKPWLGFKLLVAILSAGAVALSTLWMRRAGRPLPALAAGVVLAMGPGLLVMSSRELSDIPFWICAAVAMLALERPRQPRDALEAPGEGSGTPQRSARRTAMLAVLAGVALSCAWLTRTAALPLLLAAGVWLLARRDWRALGLVVAGAIPGFAAWLAWYLAAGANSAYLSSFWWRDPYLPALGRATPIDLLLRVGDNSRHYLSERLPNLLMGPTPLGLAIVVGVGLTLLAGYGWVRRLRRPGFADVVAPLYLGLLLIWPSQWADERYLLPILPLVLLYAAETLGSAGVRLKAPRLLPVAALALLALPGIRSYSDAVSFAAGCRDGVATGDLGLCYSPVWASQIALYQQLRGRLPQGTVILARKPSLLWALSGYRSRQYPLTGNPDDFLAEVRRTGARYVVLDRSGEGQRNLRPLVISHPDLFCLVPEVGYEGAALARIGTDHRLPPGGTAPGQVISCER
jgi:4-amino-4-deoxy-L-arabinose transferase-like glycosyltransferase